MPAYKVTMDPKTGETIYTEVIGKADDNQYGASTNKGYTNWGIAAEQAQSNTLKASNTAKPVAPVQPQYNPLDQMEQLKQAQLKASMAGLDKQRTNSLSNLSAERAVIEPEYQKKKIGALTTAKQTARSFDEYMAQRGSSNSGIAGQGTLLNNLGYQGAKNTLDTAEAGAITDNARRVTGVQNNYESDVVGAEAGIQAQYLQNYINQMNQDRTFNYGVSRDTVADSRYDTETAYNQERNTLADTRYADETQYNRSQAEMEWEFKQQGYSDDQAYKMATLAIQQQNANRTSGGSSGGSSPVKYSNTSTASLKDKMDSALANGARVDELIYELSEMEQDGSLDLKKVDAAYLKSYLEGKLPTMNDLRRSQGGGI